MFTSFYGQISAIMDIIIGLSPKSILDIGAGYGKYGFLCREHLDLSDGRMQKCRWGMRIEGIDIDPNTKNPVHGFVYDQFHYDDAAGVVPGLKRRYDLALMIDLLGYLPREKGLQLVEDSLLISKMLLVVISGNSLSETGHTWMPNDFDLFDVMRTGFLPTGKGHAGMVLLVRGNLIPD